MSTQKPLSFTTLLSALPRFAQRAMASLRQSHSHLELAGMSDRELQDLGIGRSEVPEWSRRRAPGSCVTTTDALVNAG